MPSLENVYSDSVLILKIGLFGFLWMFSFMSSFILNINPLTNILFGNIFSHSVDSIFVLVVVSFYYAGIFSLMQPDLLIFAFVSLAWREVCKRTAKTAVKECSVYFLLEV